jgi:3-deoxy-7-phosphoheptulonate synthase
VNRTGDLRIRKSRPLIAPSLLEREVQIGAEAATAIREHRRQISEIVHGRDPRLLFIVGPCSIHDPESANEYADRLLPVAKAVSESVMVVMRIYFEKPRTTVGWKGYINDPGLDGTFEVNAGLRGARRLLADVAELGMPAASEFLDTTFGQYYSDLISWGAIGARTVESQVHRQLASGLSMPVGIKNRTDGNVEVALDALVATRDSHHFPSLTKEGEPALLETTGNADAHLVLRGGSRPNYDEESVRAVVEALDARGLDTGIVVDCSHGNSGKDPTRQADGLESVLAQRKSGQRRLIGVMLESHLVGGRQDEPITYGQSITDACLGWDETVKLIEKAAEE